MNTRILRIELTRTIAGWAALVSVAVALGFLYAFSGPWSKDPVAWDEQWVLAALWSRFLLVFLWPIAVGAGVLQGMRDSRSGMVELLRTMPRPGWHRAAKLAAALAALLVLAYLLIFAVGAVQVVANGGFFTLAWLPIVLVGVLAISAGAWLGLGVGRLLPHPLTAPAVTVAAFVAVAVSQLAPTESNVFTGVVPLQAAWLSPALGTVRDPFLTTTGRMDVGQAVWLLGLAVTGILLLAASSRRAKALAALPVLAGLVTAVPILPATVAEARTTDTVAAARVCDGPVCVTRVHEAELARIARPGKEALRLLQALPGAPTKVVERAHQVAPDEVAPRAAGAVLVDFDQPSTSESTEPEDLTRSLLAGAGTPSCYPPRMADKPFVDELAARAVMASWFLGELKPLQGNVWAEHKVRPVLERSWTVLRALPQDEQWRRIVAARQAGLTCQGSQLAILAGGGVAR